MPEPAYIKYKVTLTTLTPLHIGSGVELLNEYDYAVHGGRTWRINEAALLEAQDVDDPSIAARLAQTPPAQLLREADYAPTSPFFRYVIRGVPRSSAPGASLREQIKDAFDRPYLPGTSLKGALRTALAWHAWGRLRLEPAPADLNPRREWAAQNLERQIFGPNPNKDSLRALEVGDSAPLPAERLALVNAGVVNRGGLAAKVIPVEVEAVRPETTFTLEMKIDLALFSDWARRKGLELAGLDALLALPQVVQARSRQRARRELEWFSGQAVFKNIRAFYQQLAEARVEPNQFLIQLGWGTGWDGMTFGSRLREQPRLLAQAIERYRLARGAYREGDPFPKSRRVAMKLVEQPDGRKAADPAVPLGWALVTLEPLNELPPEWRLKAKEAAARFAPAPAPAPAAPPQAAAPAQAPTAQAPAAQPAPRPQVVRRFERMPRPGERFEGVVLDTEPSGRILLEIPGLDTDTAAMAVVMPAENPAGKRYAEGKRLLCEVLEVHPDPAQKSYSLELCRLA